MVGNVFVFSGIFEWKVAGRFRLVQDVNVGFVLGFQTHMFQNAQTVWDLCDFPACCSVLEAVVHASDSKF